MKMFWIFDLDGTLLDTLEGIAVGVNRALVEVGAPEISTDRVRCLVGEGARNLVARALPESRVGEVDRTLQCFLSHYGKCQFEFSRLYPGVRETLAALSGHPMAVATNKPEVFSRQLLEWFGIASYFPVVVGGDTLAVRKPDAKYMTEVLDRLAVKGRRGWMVGDTGIDIQAGKAVGLSTLAVTYGFRDRETLMAHAPDRLVDSFEDLLTLIQG